MRANTPFTKSTDPTASQALTALLFGGALSY
jgi:hypothetical protein